MVMERNTPQSVTLWVSRYAHSTRPLDAPARNCAGHPGSNKCVRCRPPVLRLSVKIVPRLLRETAERDRDRFRTRERVRIRFGFGNGYGVGGLTSTLCS